MSTRRSGSSVPFHQVDEIRPASNEHCLFLVHHRVGHFLSFFGSIVVLASFHRGVEVLLGEVRANGGLHEPAIAVINITPWQVYASPYKDDEDVSEDDEPVVVNGNERYPHAEYPDMIHGLTGKYERGYVMATITIIGEDTPIVLGIEPVRRASQWEAETGEMTAQADLVEQLLKQAAQHVKMHKVFCDRGFDVNGFATLSTVTT